MVTADQPCKRSLLILRAYYGTVDAMPDYSTLVTETAYCGFSGWLRDSACPLLALMERKLSGRRDCAYVGGPETDWAGQGDTF
jgi:hypothetical protein